MIRTILAALVLIAIPFAMPTTGASCVTATVQEGDVHLADAQAGTSCQPWVVLYECQVHYFGGWPALEWTCTPLLEGPVTPLA